MSDKKEEQKDGRTKLKRNLGKNKRNGTRWIGYLHNQQI